MKNYKSQSAQDTIKIGQEIAKTLKPGDVVVLSGELGAGKTTLVKGIAKGLGVKNESEVSSPTFALIHEYRGRVKIYHLDWYRIDKVQGDDAEMAEECFASEGITFVEWPERGKGVLPKKYTSIRIQHKGPSEREIHVQ